MGGRGKERWQEIKEKVGVAEEGTSQSDERGRNAFCE